MCKTPHAEEPKCGADSQDNHPFVLTQCGKPTPSLASDVCQPGLSVVNVLHEATSAREGRISMANALYNDRSRLVQNTRRSRDLRALVQAVRLLQPERLGAPP